MNSDSIGILATLHLVWTRHWNDGLICFVQEVGSIIGKKGEIVKRFREEVSHQVLVIPSRFFTEFYRVFRDCGQIGSHWTGSCLVLPGFYWFYRVLLGFHWLFVYLVLPGFYCFYRVLLGFYWV